MSHEKHSKFKQIQEEHLKWRQHNFPGQETWMPLMGLVEELGELREANDGKEVVDAIGDCCIYLADYCNGMGYDLDWLYNYPEVERIVDWGGLVGVLGKLCHSHLKMTQRIRMTEDHKKEGQYAISQILAFLQSFHTVTLDQLVYKIWENVRKRDWIKDQNTAHVRRYEEE